MTSIGHVTISAGYVPGQNHISVEKLPEFLAQSVVLPVRCSITSKVTLDRGQPASGTYEIVSMNATQMYVSFLPDVYGLDGPWHLGDVVTLLA